MNQQIDMLNLYLGRVHGYNQIYYSLGLLQIIYNTLMNINLEVTQMIRNDYYTAVSMDKDYAIGSAERSLEQITSMKQPVPEVFEIGMEELKSEILPTAHLYFYNDLNQIIEKCR